MSNVISFSGFQSVGKTTATFALASELKKRGLSVNLWADIPRRCPLKINEDGGSATQFWIMSKMIQETLELANIFDVVITDRSPFDCVVYEAATSSGMTDRATTMLKYLYEFRTEVNMRILYVDDGYEFVMEEGRSVDGKFRELSRYYFDMVYGQLVKVDFRIGDLRQLDLKELADKIMKLMEE